MAVFDPVNTQSGTQAHRVSSLLFQLKEGTFSTVGMNPIPTGFEPLDSVLNGGFLPGEVILLGAQPGQGKTICALQWARNMAMAGRRATYACFEHDEATLLNRLLVQEMATVLQEPDADAPFSDRVQARTAIRDLMLGVIDLREAVVGSPIVESALRSVAKYAHNLQFLRASSQRTTPEEIELQSLPHLEAGGLLVVDYLQKLPVPGVPSVEERVYRAVEIMKEFAISHQVSVVAISAASGRGIGVDRLRLEHLRGSDALAHECDVAILMNPKVTATSERHLKFDLTQMDDARRRTIFSVEKNRRGEVDVHLEFEKDFANFRFEPRGAFVTESLEGD